VSKRKFSHLQFRSLGGKVIYAAPSAGKSTFQLKGRELNKVIIDTDDAFCFSGDFEKDVALLQSLSHDEKKDKVMKYLIEQQNSNYKIDFIVTNMHDLPLDYDYKYWVNKSRMNAYMAKRSNVSLEKMEEITKTWDRPKDCDMLLDNQFLTDVIKLTK
jgi:hypothetical protein